MLTEKTARAMTAAEKSSLPLMSPAFHVVQPGDIQLLDAAPCGDHDIVRFPLFDPADGPVQALAEREIADRLEYVVHRVHGVAPDGVLCHIGDENNDHLRIQLANFRGGGHSVDKRHLYIKQDKVELGTVILQQAVAVRIGGDLQLRPTLLPVTLQKELELLRIDGVILRDGDPEHIRVPFPDGAVRSGFRKKKARLSIILLPDLYGSVYTKFHFVTN